MKIYSKPELLIFPVHWAKWPKLAQKSKIADLALPWAKLTKQEFSTSKSVSIKASADKIWDVVSDPKNAEVYLDTVVSVDMKDENTYVIKEVGPPTEKRNWMLLEYPMKVLRKEKGRSHMFSVDVDGGTEEFGFTLDRISEKETVLTYSMKSDFAVSNYYEIGRNIENMLYKIAKMSLGQEQFREAVKAK